MHQTQFTTFTMSWHSPVEQGYVVLLDDRGGAWKDLLAPELPLSSYQYAA